MIWDGNGGMRGAWARRLFMDQVDLMDQMDKMGAPRYTPRGLLGAVWYGSGADLLLGYAGFFMATGADSPSQQIRRFF